MKLNLKSNSFEYRVTSEKDFLYYGETKNPFAKEVTKEKYADIIKSVMLKDELKFHQKTENFWYAFTNLDGLNNEISIQLNQNKTL